MTETFSSMESSTRIEDVFFSVAITIPFEAGWGASSCVAIMNNLRDKAYLWCQDLLCRMIRLREHVLFGRAFHSGRRRWASNWSKSQYSLVRNRRSASVECTDLYEPPSALAILTDIQDHVRERSSCKKMVFREIEWGVRVKDWCRWTRVYSVKRNSYSDMGIMAWT